MAAVRRSVARGRCVAWLVVWMAFAPVAVGGQQTSAPQTGGARVLWPQRPGPRQPIALPTNAPAPAPLAQAPPDAAPEFVPNQVLVQFEAGVDEATRQAARQAVGATSARVLTDDGRRLELMTTTLDVPLATALLQAIVGVEFAEPNFIVRHAATSNDPRFTDGSLFGMYGDASTPANAFGSQAAEAWARGFTGSSQVYVGVIDEGIDVSHPDLAPNIWVNPFDPVDGIDNDGNGYVDDRHGWDFFQNNNTVYDGAPGDTNTDSHGTHVAGTIGARGGNGIGVAGVNWHVTLISGKFLGPVDGTTAAATAAVLYFTDLKVRHGLNIVATNNSWGGGAYSQALHQAIVRAAKQNILFVAAAGNGGPDGIGDDNDVTAYYPAGYATNVAVGSESAAGYDAVIAVASLTSGGTRSSFSNYGAASVDIAAPGSSVLSTWPQGGYATSSGTSMATPHVSGAVALYRSINPTATAAQIRQAMLDHGTPTAAMAGITTTGDRLNVGDFTLAVNMTISDARVREGDSGTRLASFTVALSSAAPVALSVDYATADGTAFANAPSNRSGIAIPASGNASPYPSSITVPGGVGTLSGLRVVLHGFSHGWPGDVDVLLVGPSGQTCVLMSDVGSSVDATNLTLTFDDGGAVMPAAAGLSSTTYRPTNNGTGDLFPSPAPAGTHGTSLAAFAGTAASGTWQLFVLDDSGGDGGAITGWSLELTTTVSPDYNAAAGTLTIPAGATAATLSVAVRGDVTVETAETFVVTLSGASANLLDATGVGTIMNDDFTDASLTGLAIKAIHLTELRTGVNDARAALGLAPFAFTDALVGQVTTIRAVHLVELRTAINQAYAAARRIPPAFTDPVITPGATPVRAAHITELRAAILGLE